MVVVRFALVVVVIVVVVAVVAAVVVVEAHRGKTRVAEGRFPLTWVVSEYSLAVVAYTEVSVAYTKNDSLVNDGALVGRVVEARPRLMGVERP